MNQPDNTQEEPQEARGAPGSRDEGEGPGGGPVDRPTATADAEDDSGVNPLGPKDPDMPNIPTGDGG